MSAKVVDYRLPVFLPAATDTIGQHSDLKTLAEGIHHCLIHADRGFQTPNEKMTHIPALKFLEQTLGANGGKSGLGEKLRFRSGGGEFWLGCSEFFGNLFGDINWQFQQCSRFQSELAAANQLLILREHSGKDGLNIDQ